ncbi:hypothetical protein SUGI_0102240 [Cryptomeria japonica]|nr:hypothetical protein SUGI_0102240 [Cryptomeria japonica]
MVQRKLHHRATREQWGSLKMSYDRQHQIDAIEEERAFFERENKALKKSMWTLKEGLLQEAAKQNDHDLICRLKAIFGQTSTIEERRPDSTVPKTKFVI